MSNRRDDRFPYGSAHFVARNHNGDRDARLDQGVGDRLGKLAFKNTHDLTIRDISPPVNLLACSLLNLSRSHIRR